MENAVKRFFYDILYIIRYTKWSTLMVKILCIGEKTLSSFVPKFCFENILTFLVLWEKCHLHHLLVRYVLRVDSSKEKRNVCRIS